MEDIRRNPWFKFYGTDWLNDFNIIQLCPEDRLCYVTLLCLASQNNGLIKNCNENILIALTHLYNDPTEDDNAFTRAKGCLKRFESNGSVTISEAGTVKINNWEKRQSNVLSNAERQAKYRDKSKSNEIVTDERNESNVRGEERRGDKIRGDKIRGDKSKSRHGEFEKVLLSSEEYEKLKERMGEKNTEILVNELDAYIASKGKKYSSHYATILSWANRKIKEHKMTVKSKGRGLEI